jgi:hypothetical protein
MSYVADISGEDFFYQVLEDIEVELEAGPSHTQELTPNTPKYTPSTISPLTSENPT